MARHRIRTRLPSVLLAGAASMILALLLMIIGSGSANATYTPIAPGKSVTPSNSVVKGKCGMTVQGVNGSTSQVSVRLAAQAQPATLAGYGTNVYTQVFCSVYDNSGNRVATNNPFANGPSVSNTAAQFVVPFSSQFFVCGQAFVKLNNGSTSLTPVVCA